MHVARCENKTGNILHPKAETECIVVFGLQGAGDLLTLEFENWIQNVSKVCLCGMCQIQFPQRKRSSGMKAHIKAQIMQSCVWKSTFCFSAVMLEISPLWDKQRFNLSYLISAFLTKLQECCSKITTLLSFNVLWWRLKTQIRSKSQDSTFSSRKLCSCKRTKKKK